MTAPGSSAVGWLRILESASIGGRTSDSAFQECVEQSKSSGGNQNPYESIAAFQVFLSPYRECVGAFAHTNAEPIIAAFTFILALSTIALWFATRRLVKESEEASQRQIRAWIGIESIELTAPNLTIKTYKPIQVGIGRGVAHRHGDRAQSIIGWMGSSIRLRLVLAGLGLFHRLASRRDASRFLACMQAWIVR